MCGGGEGGRGGGGGGGREDERIDVEAYKYQNG